MELMLVFTAVDRQESLWIILHWRMWPRDPPAAGPHCLHPQSQPGGAGDSHPSPWVPPKPSSLSLVGRAVKGLGLHPRLDGIVRSERVAVTGAIAREGRGDLSW